MRITKILGNLAEDQEFGPDPIILRKHGTPLKDKKMADYKRKIQDPNYVDFAINKIAMELSHFISK